MIIFLENAIKIIFLLGFLVFIHEGGHFLVAKLCKVKVNEFAIGFGPTLFKFKKKETTYAVRLIPLGGFVSLEGEDEHSDNEESYTKASIPKRMAIIVAGAAVNIVFGVLVYFILSASSGNFYTTTVDYTLQDYAANNSGIQANDVIVSINNKKVKNKNDISKILEETNGESLKLLINRAEQLMEINLEPTAIENKDIGVYFKEGNNNSIKVVSVQSNSAAEKSGLKENDEIIKIDGIDTRNDIYNALTLIQESKNEVIEIEIKRNKEYLNIKIKPDVIKTYYLGVAFKKVDNSLINNIYYGGLETKDFFLSIGENLKQLITGKVKTNQMMGVVGISEVVTKTKGFVEYIYMLALISLSLGITNLLPFPPLDGGKFIFLIVELIRKKPIKEELEIKIQMIGFSILIGLSIYITYNDILRIL